MPFPDYTIEECTEAIQAIDAELVKLRKLATKFALDKKSFDYTGKRKELLDERTEWMTRYNALAPTTDAATGAPNNSFQGPRIVPV